jgi:hypothetical protein
VGVALGVFDVGVVPIAHAPTGTRGGVHQHHKFTSRTLFGSQLPATLPRGTLDFGLRVFDPPGLWTSGF